MGTGFRRTLRHGTLLVFALVAATVLFPAQAYAGCACGGGSEDESGSRPEVNITLRVAPADGGYVKVDGEELEDDIYVASQGDKLELEAVPAQGYRFVRWSGSVVSSENPVERECYNHKDITANFVLEKESLSQLEKSGLSVDIPDGTEALDADGNELDDVSIEVAAVHDVPTTMTVVSRVYDVLPSGATFDPPITLTFEYDQASVPAGVDENELTVAWFDEESGAWTPLKSDVNEEDGIVTADVAHFSEFCVLSPTPASGLSGTGQPTSPGFSLSQLEVSPSSVAAGEPVTVSVLAHYEGASSDGASLVVLRVDGTEVDQQQVTLPSGESAEVAFTFTPSTGGPHEIDVNGLLGGLNVISVASPLALSQAVALAQDGGSFQLEAPSQPEAPGQSSFSWLRGWPPVAVVVMGVVVVLLVLFLLLLVRQAFRRRYDM
ncbi:MAG: hypothetical protein M0R22_05915 [Dehalococcoidia bacterium]|jgi:hypothetical protein|nr:hypothetical protein [Dehalococcoidia bacterium]